MLSASTLQFLSMVFFILAAILFVISSVLFFVLKVPQLFGEITGLTMRKDIEAIRQKNAQLGKGKKAEIHAIKPKNAEIKDNITAILGDDIRKKNLKDSKLGVVKEIPKELSSLNETTVLTADETTLLGTDETTVLTQLTDLTDENSNDIYLKLVDAKRDNFTVITTLEFIASDESIQ